jgi:YesN/AraC family two-component response regulator
LFKEVTGKSITEFISTIRIERAKELLTSTNNPIRDIGESVGYADQNYFSRCFKRIEGCSPMKYRKNEGALYDEKEQFI